MRACVFACVCVCVCVCGVCMRAHSGEICERMQVCEREGMRILMLLCVRMSVRTTEFVQVCVRQFVREWVSVRAR